MTDDIDFYDLLDVSPDASQDEIKEAFREQVRVYHPDLNDDDRARAQFTALKKAYDILGDPVERRAYDRLGHEDYVAKRTSGLPSPDLWKKRTSASSTDATASDQSGGTGAASRTNSRDSSGTASATGSTRSSTAGRTRSHSTGSGPTHTSRSATSSATGGPTTGPTSNAGSNATTGRARTSDSRSRTGGYGRPADGPFGDSTVVRWWRNQNFSTPLLWTATLLYLAGLFHFVLENESALLATARELEAIGTDPAALWGFLTESRHGIDTIVGFVTAVELLEPPLDPLEWYALLGGIVALSLVLVLGARVAWRVDTWGPVSIDETIVVAIALTIATTLVGGPLLAGIVLLPLLFGVVVYRTHQLPGWSPSYVYVGCVGAPLLGLAVTQAGYATLPLDLLLFVALPLLGAFGVPIRVSIRKRFGR